MFRLRIAFSRHSVERFIDENSFPRPFWLRAGGGRARNPARRLSLTERERLENVFAQARWAPGSAETRLVPGCGAAQTPILILATMASITTAKMRFPIFY